MVPYRRRQTDVNYAFILTNETNERTKREEKGYRNECYYKYTIATATATATPTTTTTTTRIRKREE